MRPADRGYMHSLRCDAPATLLWRALLQPEALRLWHADDAQVVPRLGGFYAYRSRLFGARQAHIDAFEPQRRLRLVYHPNPAWPPPGDSVIVEDFMIDSRPGAGGAVTTSLRLLGSGVPGVPEWNATLRRLQAGWAVAFSYLQRRLESHELERIAS